MEIGDKPAQRNFSNSRDLVSTLGFERDSNIVDVERKGGFSPRYFLFSANVVYIISVLSSYAATTNGRQKSHFVPEGRLTIAHQFIGGSRGDEKSHFVPEGRLKIAHQFIGGSRGDDNPNQSRRGD